MNKTKITRTITLKPLCGTARLGYENRILPKNKSEKEKFIAEEFAKIKKIDNCILKDIKINEDTYKKPDVICKLNNNDVGIQLTELKIEHRPHSSNVANKLTTNLLNFILKSIKPCSKILVNIYSNKDYENDILKLNDKELKEIAKIIVDGINKEKFFPNPDEFFKNKPLKLNHLNVPPNLKKKIKSMQIQKIKENQEVYCFGRDNIYINFNFDSTISDDEIIDNLLGKIYDKKEGGKAEILLIWCCDQDFWFKGDEIVKSLRKKFEKTGFRYIYFFQFMDVEKLFEANKKVSVIKEIGELEKLI